MYIRLKSEGEFFPVPKHHALKRYGWVDVYLRKFLNLLLKGMSTFHTYSFLSYMFHFKIFTEIICIFLLFAFQYQNVNYGNIDEALIRFRNMQKFCFRLWYKWERSWMAWWWFVMATIDRECVPWSFCKKCDIKHWLKPRLLSSIMVPIDAICHRFLPQICYFKV